MTRQELKRFYDENSKWLFNISFGIVGSGGEAEEIMHDTLLKYLSAAEHIPEGAQSRAWLRQTCIRASVDAVRRRASRTILAEDYRGTVEDGDSGWLEEFKAAQIRKGIEALEEPYRMTLTLILIEGLDYEEIAEYTNEKPVTIRSRYSRGRAKLIKLLKDEKRN